MSKRRPANAWPLWKLRAMLPDSRRWDVLHLVCLTGPGDHGEWQFQLPDGVPAGVGLFASREYALAWAKTHVTGRVAEGPMEAAS